MKDNLLGLLLDVLNEKELKIESGYVRYIFHYSCSGSVSEVNYKLEENYSSIEYIKWLSYIGNLYLKYKTIHRLNLECEIFTNKGILTLKYDFVKEEFYFFLETKDMQILKRNVETLLYSAFQDKYRHGLTIDGCLLSKDVYTMTIQEMEVIALIFGLELADLYIENEDELLQKVNIYISKVIFNKDALIHQKDVKAVLNLIRIGNAYKKMDRIKYGL